MIGLNKQKKTLVIIGLFIVMLAAFAAGHYKFGGEPNSDPNAEKELNKLGLITDIHAGNEDTRIINDIIYGYPREYKKLFAAALSQMKDNGVDLVIATGDNTNNGKNQYADTLVRIAEEHKMEVVWVKGNHDREKTKVMQNFGVKDKYYYYIDKNHWRVIVLDSSEINPSSTGGISPEQMAWLKQSLQTEKNVIIAMHHPIYDEFDLEKAHDTYDEFQKLIAEAGNVKHIFAGHYHTLDWTKDINGVNYYITKALTLEKDKPNFRIINL